MVRVFYWRSNMEMKIETKQVLITITAGTYEEYIRASRNGMEHGATVLAREATYCRLLFPTEAQAAAFLGMYKLGPAFDKTPVDETLQIFTRAINSNKVTAAPYGTTDL